MTASIEDRIRSLRDQGPLGGAPPVGLAELVSQRIDARIATVRRQRRVLAAAIAVVVFAAGVTVGVRSGGGDDRMPWAIGSGAMLSLVNANCRFHVSPSVEAADVAVIPYLLLEMRHGTGRWRAPSPGRTVTAA